MRLVCCGESLYTGKDALLTGPSQKRDSPHYDMIRNHVVFTVLTLFTAGDGASAVTVHIINILLNVLKYKQTDTLKCEVISAQNCML